MLPNRRKKSVEQLGIRSHEQPRIRLQFQQIQQLFRLAMQRNRLTGNARGGRQAAIGWLGAFSLSSHARIGLRGVCFCVRAVQPCLT